MEKDELNDLLREVCRDEILKDARPTLTTLKALHADRPLLVLALSQAIDAITELGAATAREARLVEALEHYRFKCERGYCGHAHRDELPKCHVEGCECVSLDNRAAAALAEYRGEK